MPIATKNGSLIVKDGKLAESCGCCGGWYCCTTSQCVSDSIRSVTASVSASDWSYQLTLTSTCATRYATSYFSGGSAPSSISLAYDRTSCWCGQIANINCTISIRYLPYFVRTRPLSGGLFVQEAVARLELRATAKTSANTSSLLQASDISCASPPSLSASLLPDASVSDEVHSACIDRLSPLTSVYTLQPPSISISSDCRSQQRNVEQTGSPAVSVTVTPNY